MMAFACQFGEIDVLTSDGTLAVSYVPSHRDRRRWPNVFAPSWSPDATRLAFIETTSDSATNYALDGVAVKVMNADGSNVVTIATTPSTAAAGGWVGPNNLSLCWMADGSRVVFNVLESELVGHLWVAKSGRKRPCPTDSRPRCVGPERLVLSLTRACQCIRDAARR